MSEEIRNQMTYLVLLNMIRRIAKKKTVDITVLERLNRKNAESLKCVYVAI